MPRIGDNAKNFFLFGLIAFSLLIQGWSIIAVLYYLIDYAKETPSYWQMSSFGSSLAGLIISGIFLTVLIGATQRLQANGHITLENPVRHWMLYIILVIPAIICISTLIIILSNYLSGEITSRALLKSISLIGVCGIYILYFASALRRKDASLPWQMKIVSLTYGVIFFSVLVAGFMKYPSPSTMRGYREDNHVVQQLSNIKAEIFNFYQGYGHLPKDLSELTNFKPSLSETIHSLVSKNNLEFKGVDKKVYELCATFKTASLNEGSNFAHRQGHQCLKQVINNESRENFYS